MMDVKKLTEYTCSPPVVNVSELVAVLQHKYHMAAFFVTPIFYAFAMCVCVCVCVWIESECQHRMYFGLPQSSGVLG